MPASSTVSFFDGLEVSTEPTVEPNPVYYTDDCLNFTVSVENNNSKYEWADDSVVRWRVTIDGEERDSGKIQFGPLENGEKEQAKIQTGALSYEGHGVLEFTSGGASGNSDSPLRTLHPGKWGSGDPAYSFSVWDKSHYQASIRRPKQLQVGIILTSIALIGFAVLQILLSTGGV